MSVRTATLSPVDVMRRLERRLEAVLEGAGGQLFRGAPHVSELAGSIVRVLDLSVDSEGLVPNKVHVPSPVPPESSAALEQAITEAVIERGWRIEGPIEVVPSETRAVTVVVERGPLPVWGELVGSDNHTLRVNRAILGRSSGCDVVVDDASVSRRHARLWRQDDRILCVDLNSSNGTSVDGAGVGPNPTEVRDGSELALGAIRFRFRRRDDA